MLQKCYIAPDTRKVMPMLCPASGIPAASQSKYVSVFAFASVCSLTNINQLCLGLLPRMCKG